MKQVLRLTIMMLVTRTVLGQSPPPRQASPAPTIRSTSTLVMVPALVLSDSGKLVRGLGASDFRLTDNGIEQKISVEVAEPQSLARSGLLPFPERTETDGLLRRISQRRFQRQPRSKMRHHQGR